MGKKAAAIVGLIGGILATVSIALTWVSISFSETVGGVTIPESASASGLDILSGVC